MQLILNSETDIGITRKMSVIEQETFDETFMTKNVTRDLSEFPSINEDTNQQNLLKDGEEDIDTKSETTSNHENALEKNTVEHKNIDHNILENNSNDLTIQYQNGQTNSKETEHIEAMEIDLSESTKNIQEKCNDIEMTDLHIQGSDESLNKEYDNTKDQTVKATEKENIILQENTLQLEKDLNEPNPKSDEIKINIEELKPDSDNLISSSDDLRPDIGDLITDSNDFKPDSCDLKPEADEVQHKNIDSDAIEQDNFNVTTNSLTPSSNEPGSNSDDLNLKSKDLNEHSNALKADNDTSIAPEIKSHDLESGHDLKSECSDLKTDSDEIKSCCENVDPDSTDIKSHSDDPKSDVNEIKSSCVDLKPDSNNVQLKSSEQKSEYQKPNFGNINLVSDDIKPETNDSKTALEGTENDKEIDVASQEEENKPTDSENLSEIDLLFESEASNKDNEDDHKNNEIECQEIVIQELKTQPFTENNNLENEKEMPKLEEAQETEMVKDDTDDRKESNNVSLNNNDQKEPKKLSLICKLSNTLDILSDDEEEASKTDAPAKEVLAEKQCIQIEDDDDIMLIDDNSTPPTNNNNAETSIENAPVPEEINKIDDKIQEEPPKEIDMLEENSADSKKAEKEINKKDDSKEKPADSPKIPKSLLPVTFLKTCKKNLSDMTRDELEEFCILKIVESVVDRSNLSEIKSQLKLMASNIEEYKKKATVLTKQNRDLQVVLKSVQEEQKKKTDLPITPLKITRSVGMQVFMTDKTVARKKPVAGPNTSANSASNNSSVNKQNKNPVTTTKPQKSLINSSSIQQIPVPRLVPASNTSTKVQSPSANSPAKTTAPTTPNGVRSSPPIQKAVKRPVSKIGNSVTVDLTDDEPPAKLAQMNVNPPVRLVPPQNLLAPQRQPFGSSMNSPRKVFIPISGSQNHVRPGPQTFMLKPLVPQGTRQRSPAALPKQNTNSMRMTRIASRHPAPLPDCMKQYQPPNWKSLPPAPELNLSKVENGIVISWKISGYQEENHEEIASYQLYAYQETSSPPSTALWKKIGDVKALPLPMACTLTQFTPGNKYYFAVRAVDIRSRLGPFSAPGSILLLNKI